MPIDSHLSQADPFSLVPTFNALKSMLIGVHSLLNFLDRFFAQILFAHLKQLQFNIMAEAALCT
jgi:hypothetical protein